MPLVLILGCMFSGKTTELLRRVDKLVAINKKVLVIHSPLDTRVEGDLVQTHSGTTKIATTFKSLKDVPYDEYDAIAIDEGQFFDDILDVIPYLDKTLVLIAGLNGSFNRKNIGHLHKLIPHADDIVFKKAYCASCKDITPAVFSKRLTDSTKEIDVGAADKYMAVCRKCF